MRPFARMLATKQSTATRAFHTTSTRLSKTSLGNMSALVSIPEIQSAAPSDVASKAHHNKNGTGFRNPWSSYVETTGWTTLPNLLWRKLSARSKTPDTTSQTVPARRPDFLPSRLTDRLRATWLGHACYYIEFPGGLRVLFDPVFTDRCGPFSTFGPQRFTQPPCQIQDIPFIDVVVISHNHYDHLSHPTIQQIVTQHPRAHFFVPLGLKKWFQHMKFGSETVTEMDWWEENELKLSPSTSDVDSTRQQADITATFGCLPAQHMTARTGFDQGHTLWASWSVSSGGKKVWFGGDTGYRSVPEISTGEFDYAEKYSNLPHCPVFAQIGDLRGPFDLGLISIGAYAPRHLFSGVHCNPYDSVNVFVDTKCSRAIGIHWGTWALSEEEVFEPPRLLRQALKWKGLAEEGVFDVCDVGESREF